jgi:hypothetical protein
LRVEKLTNTEVHLLASIILNNDNIALRLPIVRKRGEADIAIGVPVKLHVASGLLSEHGGSITEAHISIILPA